MAQYIQAIRGMNDILPQEVVVWQHVEAVLRNIVNAYGFQEIRFPIVEKTELFKRSIGEVTDIVEKEMYTFEDRNGDSLTLRPEGTAACARAGIEHGLLYNQIQRLWYIGPMFRHERPQKGRYRQFHQFSTEVFGIANPAADAELILMTVRLWRMLGVDKQVSLQINSLGSAAARAKHREHLVAYFTQHLDALDEDSKRRLASNPLRILDSKNPAMQSLIAGAPQLLDHLDEESAQHFADLQRLLDAAKVTYVVNPRLVRGLDYYNKTVFEWVMGESGAQNAVCAGGRYDTLVEQLGGQATTAVGFSIGLERLVQLVTESQAEMGQSPHAYLIMFGDLAQQQGMVLAEQLRDAIPELRLLVDCAGGGFKNQFKRADKSGAIFALVLGEDEVKANSVTLKYLREDKPQEMVKIEKLASFLGAYCQ